MAKTGIFYETQPGGGLTSDQALARDTLRELHPQSTEASDDDMLPVRDASGAVRRYSTSSKEYRDAFWEVFHSVPKARAMSVDGVSYEELEFLFYGGADPRQVLFDIVASINRVGDEDLGRPSTSRDRKAGRRRQLRFHQRLLHLLPTPLRRSAPSTSIARNFR